MRFREMVWLLGPDPEGDYHMATDVSADGLTVVGWHGIPAGSWDGIFIWKASADPAVVPRPENCYFLSIDGPVVSGDGRTIIANCYDVETEGEYFVKWTASGGYERLGDGTAVDISTDGNVIVGTTFDDRAFRYTDAVQVVDAASGSE
jgi:hypothetical protein